MTSRTPWCLAVAAALLAGACRPPRPAPAPVVAGPAVPTPPTAAARWARSWTQVESLLSESRFAAADSVLVAYVRSAPPGGLLARAQLWRVLLKLEPRSTGGDMAGALALLDSIVADSAMRDVRAEGLLLRRGLAATDSLRRLELRRRAAATQQASERAEELRVARDSLARLSAELQRLTRRLRSP